MSISTGDRIGPYEVLGPVGAGGMGTVYRARDARLRRSVAIKVIAGVAEPDLVRRFETEALAASALNHPNIITVYEFGVHEGRNYLVTEFIEGQTLRERMRRGPLPVDEALNLAVQIVSALEAAHAASLIHRDVKPENVMIRPDGYVKVVDFGLAKVEASASAVSNNTTVALSTQPGIILGTLGYMAPEQVRGLPVDGRADVWSLGVVLHEMISGRSPFAGPTASDVIASVLERQPPLLQTDASTVPSELERIVRKCLAKDRNDRYQTMRDLSIDLRQLQRQQIENAQDAGGARVVQDGTAARRPRPHRSRASIAAALIGALVVLTGVAWLIHMSSSRETSGISAPTLVRRSLDYRLIVQKEMDQKPVEATPEEEFDKNSRFQFNFRSTEAGFVYVLGETPGAPDNARLQLLFPTPSVANGSAAMRANVPLGTGFYRFADGSNSRESERVWFVWSLKELPEMERAKRWLNADDLGVIKDPAEAAAIDRLLAAHAADARASVDPVAKRTVVEGPGDILVSRADLKLK